MTHAAQTSVKECCFTKHTEMLMSSTQTVTTAFHQGFDCLRFSHADRMAMEYPTCREGQTPVGVSTP